MINQAIILAGGQGTRLRPFTDTNPKPMYQFEGKPFLEYLIMQLKDAGVLSILILLGYLPEKIIEYFGDGKSFGINICYDISPVEYDTGARLVAAKDKISDEFFLLYCDNYCPINFSKAVDKYKSNETLLQITAYLNRDNYTKNNLKFDNSGKVLVYDKSRKVSDLHAVDIGYAIVNKSVLELIPNENVNFEAIVYPKLLEKEALSVFETEHRYYSVGSYERIELTKEFFKKRKIIFLDRDGTINKRAKKAEYITVPDEFIWLEGAKEAISLLKQKGYIIILITNQPGIARGMVTEYNLNLIHNKMQHDLNENKIDKIYYCPHGWDENCDCRKPKAGMIFQAGRDLSIDLTKCILIGDDERDIIAGETAGCKSYLVNDKKTLLDIVKGLD